MGTVHRTGPLGSGHAMKALNNYVSAAGLVATAEALVIGQRFGLDGAVMTKVLNASTGRNNTTENKAERYMLNHAFNSGFALALMDKDVGMANRLAGELGIEAVGAGVRRDFWPRCWPSWGRRRPHRRLPVRRGEGWQSVTPTFTFVPTAGATRWPRRAPGSRAS